MSTRRSRAPRARKARSSEAPMTVPQHDRVPDVTASATHAVARDAGAPHPTETAQLRALEAGWDELLA